jgi:hypothetical protein
MAEDELLKSKNILPPDDENASRQIGPALIKLAGQLTPQVGIYLFFITSVLFISIPARIYIFCQQQLLDTAKPKRSSQVPTSTQKHLVPKQPNPLVEGT